jgi:hypothetical protein
MPLIPSLLLLTVTAGRAGVAARAVTLEGAVASAAGIYRAKYLRSGVDSVHVMGEKGRLTCPTDYDVWQVDETVHGDMIPKGYTMKVYDPDGELRCLRSEMCDGKAIAGLRDSGQYSSPTAVRDLGPGGTYLLMAYACEQERVRYVANTPTVEPLSQGQRIAQLRARNSGLADCADF